MRYRNDIIVKNLNMDQVSWSRTFCDSAEYEGIRVVESPVDDYQNRLFIGDTISSRMLGKRACNIYFLAAVDGTDEEHDNILKTTYTTTVSNAEKERVMRIFPDVDHNKIEVDGFPVDLNTIAGMADMQLDKIDRSVCFLGRTDADKGIGMELGLTECLSADGYSVFHLTPHAASARLELERAGSQVIEQLRGEDYLKLLSRMNCVVNTSPRESLFVSGIEAAALDIPVIAPDVADSGIWDWNDPENFYQAEDTDDAIKAIRRVCKKDTVSAVTIDQYQPFRYFDRTFGRAA